MHQVSQGPARPARNHPTQTKIQLLYNAGSIEVTTIDIEHQSIYLLLTDKDLMSPENLLFPQNKIFALPLDHPEVIDDVDTLLLHRAAYHRLVKHPQFEILCPLILYSNKTHLNSLGKLTIEPVSFTLGIFKRSTRYRDHA
jgi:hypothetical protein